MFICNNCGSIFENAKIVYERHPYGMGYAEEEICVCPNCEDTDFNEAKMCKQCGEYVSVTTDGLCEDCYEESEANG